jgi:lipopolysaccharide biosynthesis regulator YciM
LHVQAGLLYSLIRQEDLAIKKFHDALELDPQYSPAHFSLNVSYLLTGKIDEAIREMETAAQLMERNPHYTALLGFTYARAGRISEARGILEELQQRAALGDVQTRYFAIISFALDEIDKGFDLFEKAIDEGEDLGMWVYGCCLLEPWYSHPRYHALLCKMNLEP